MIRPSRRARSAALVVFGAWLASRGALAMTGLVVTGLIGLGAAIAALLSSATRAALLPDLASSAIAWGGGVMLAFGASLRALRVDREQGVAQLVAARGGTLRDYVRGRVGGLIVVLAVAVGSCTALACLAAIAATHGRRGVAPSSAGAVVYALAFAVTMGPVAIAALGARTRAGGYLSLLAVLVVPELRAPFTRRLLPPGWHELTSIPAALAAVRSGVAHPVLAGVHAARGLAGLLAVVAMALLVVAVRARASDGDAPDAREIAGPGRRQVPR
jgi:hypothetical protein